MVQRTYYPERATFAEKPPAEQAFTDDDPEVIRFGHTMGSIDALAKTAANTARGHYGSDWEDVYQTAWHAVVEHLLTAETRPERYDLVRAGQRAVNDLASDQLHHRGYFKYKTFGVQAGPGSSPAFAQFWFHSTHGGPEETVVDRVAVQQILGCLTSAQRAVLMVLALHDDYRAAASATGMTYGAFKSQVSRARLRFYLLWHEGETPSRTWRIDKRVGVYDHGE